MSEAHPNQQMHTQVVETKDGEIHITQPKGKRHHGITVLLDSDEAFKGQVGGIANFVREYAVVGLAVGFIIGLQAQTLMKQLLESFITPLLSLWLGNDLVNKHFTAGTGKDMVTFAWGKFIYSFISFLVVLIFIYAIVKLLRLDKIGKKPEAK